MFYSISFIGNVVLSEAGNNYLIHLMKYIKTRNIRKINTWVFFQAIEMDLAQDLSLTIQVRQ